MRYIDWQPYPEKQPKKEGEYLIRIAGSTSILVDYWMREGGICRWLSNCSVIAWAEPY